jgi:alpha-amylase
MGVVYHAHARFGTYVNEQWRTVPAPSDPTTPHAVWWYDWIAEHALDLRQAGFTSILYPPVCKTSGGDGAHADGYGVYDQYDIGSKPQSGSTPTRFGSRELLQRSIAVAHACGLDVYVDVVMHQLSGGNAGVYRYLGADRHALVGRFPKDPGCFRGPPPRRPEDPVPVRVDDFPFGDEFVFLNCEPREYTIDGMIAFGDWLTRSLDLDGYRVDDTKGMAVPFVHRWMTSGAMKPGYVVSEYFDGDPANLFGWVHDSGMAGRSSAFDFTLHFALQAMCDDPGFDMRGLDGAGYAARDPLNAATFVDNPDTDMSPGITIMSNKLLAYAFILTTEGYPFVFHKDYSTEAGCYGLKPYVDNLVWIHEHLANGTTTTRWNDAKSIVLERLGPPGLLTAISTDPWNRRQVTCATAFGSGTWLHDYTGRHPDIQTDGAGQATFTIPSNVDGSGQSYLCFSRQGLGVPNAVPARTTTQTFFGADDLDIPAAVAGQFTTTGRIWCAAGKPIHAVLRPSAALPSGVSLSFRVLDPEEKTLAPAHAPAASPATAATAVTAPASGWHTLEVTATGPAGAYPYELTVTYTAARSIAP